MKMKAVCKATGLTDRTVRYYIEEQLISPAYTENYLGRKTFDFSESNIDTLNNIAVFRKFGFSIQEIKEMFLYPENIPQIIGALKERKQELINEESELLRALSQLNTERSYSVNELAECLSAPVVNAPLPREDVSKIKHFMRGCGFYLAVRLTIITLSWVVLIIAMLVHVFTVKETETTDIADYGIYNGTYEDEFTQAFVDSFFPEEISPSFSNVNYSYKAMKFDTYAFEAYLEFTVEDSEEFARIIRDIAPEEKWKPFAFDEKYMEYNIENGFDISERSLKESTAEQGFAIHCAKIRKILYSSETQTIIYVALGVYDGGGATTDYLCVFFDRFSIDPAEYEALAVSPVRGDPYGIEVGNT